MKSTFVILLLILGMTAWSKPSYAASRHAQTVPVGRIATTPQQVKTSKKQRMFQRLTHKITSSPLGAKLSNKRIWALVLGGLGLIGGFFALLIAFFASAVIGILGVLVAGAFIITAGILWFI